MFTKTLTRQDDILTETVHFMQERGYHLSSRIALDVLEDFVWNVEVYGTMIIIAPVTEGVCTFVNLLGEEVSHTIKGKELWMQSVDGGEPQHIELGKHRVLTITTTDDEVVLTSHTAIEYMLQHGYGHLARPQRKVAAVKPKYQRPLPYGLDEDEDEDY